MDSLKLNFASMHRQKTPMGDLMIPAVVPHAKRIRRSMTYREGLGDGEEGDACLDETMPLDEINVETEDPCETIELVGTPLKLVEIPTGDKDVDDAADITSLPQIPVRVPRPPFLKRNRRSEPVQTASENS